MIETVITDIEKQQQKVMYELLKNSTEILFTTDAEFNIDNWNNEAAKTFQLQANDVLGKKVFDITEICIMLNWNRKEDDLKMIQQILKESGSYKNQIAIANEFMPNTIWTVTITRAINNYKIVDGYIFFIKDITHKERKEKLSFKLFDLLENSSEVLIILNKDFYITNWNKAASRVYGYASEEVIGKPVEVLKMPVEINKRLLLRNQLKITGEWSGELTYSKKDGNPIHLSIKASCTYDGNQEIDDIVMIGQDITEQKYLQEKLQIENKSLEQKVNEQNELVKGFYERISDGFVAYDAQWNYVYLNEPALRYNNKTEKEIVGKNVWSLFPNLKNTERGITYLEAMKTQQNLIVIEYNERLKIWAEFHCYPSPSGLSVFVKDITEKRKFEEDLRLSRRALESIEEGIIIAEKNNDDTRILFANDGFLKMTGYELEEVLNKNCRMLQGKETSRETKKAIKEAIKSNRHFECEILNYRKDRTIFWNQLLLSPINDDSNNVTHYVGVQKDITAQKEMIKKLSENELYYRTLFENSPMPMWIVDKESLKFLEVNNAAIAHYGYSKLEFLSMNATQIRPSEEITTFVEYSKRSPSNFHKAGSWKHIKKNGAIIDVEIMADLVLFNGKPANLVLCNDVTEKRKIQFELENYNGQLRNLAARLHKVKEEERTSIARELHDELGQQLTGIKFSTHFLKSFIEDGNIKAHQQIKEISSLLDNSIDSIRKISKNLRPIILETLGLKETLHQAGKEFENKSGIKFNFNYNEEFISSSNPLSDIVIYRIFQESLTNIMRHSEATRVYCLLNVEDNKIKLSIIDDGKGFSVEGVKTKKTLGLLGMSERIIMIGGELKIESVIDQGTKVLVTVPVNGSNN